MELKARLKKKKQQPTKPDGTTLSSSVPCFLHCPPIPMQFMGNDQQHSEQRATSSWPNIILKTGMWFNSKLYLVFRCFSQCCREVPPLGQTSQPKSCSSDSCLYPFFQNLSRRGDSDAFSLLLLYIPYWIKHSP